MGRRRSDAATSRGAAAGAARLVPDRDRPRGWTLELDGVPQSHVDLDDPTYLAFEYVRRVGHVVDLIAPAGEPVDALHLGSGGLTLARYVAATRPGSRQRVVEVDAALVELVRRELPLPRGARVRVSVGDARERLARRPDASADLVVCDVYADSRVPAHLTTTGFAAEVARVLRPAGAFADCLADGPGLPFVRGQCATLRALFASVALLAEPAVLRGRRFGNVVLVASAAPLPVAALSRRAAGDPVPARLVAGVDLDRLAASAAPVTDASAVPSPVPPSR